MATTELRPTSTEERRAVRRRPPVHLSRSVLSDEQLARAVSQGDRGAFATLYERYRTPLSRYCRSILHHADDSADAFQNAMTAAFAALEREPPSGPLKPWLYRIAHNESIDLIRRRARAGEELVAEAPEPSANSSSEVSEQLQGLLADLRLLPERQRGALLMRELAGLEYDQIGRAFATSAVAARKLVYEGRVTLGSMREGRDASCDHICRQISDGDGRTLRSRAVRAHLESCASCATFERSLDSRRRQLALVPALPVTGMGIWFATSLGGGAAGATKALAGGGAVAGGAVAGTSAIGAGAGATAGGVVSSLGGALAVKCLAVCGALAVVGAGAAIATHAPSPRASHGAPRISAAVPLAAAATVAKPSLSGAAANPTAGAATGAAGAVTTAGVGRGGAAGGTGHGSTASGARQLRFTLLGSANHGPAGAQGASEPSGPSGGGSATASAAAGATETSTTASTTTTTSASGGTGTGGSSSGASGAPGSGSVAGGPSSAAGGSGDGAGGSSAAGSSAAAGQSGGGVSAGGLGLAGATATASGGTGASRASATSGTTLAGGITRVVEAGVASATLPANETTSSISSLIAGFLGGSGSSNAFGSAGSSSAEGLAGTSAVGGAASASGSSLSGRFGLAFGH